ncbi:MAG: sensor domain-containing diguanylate cyclase [Methylococcaceae bacterium]|nr:sensor domain-containing diguanylate cyclase [Methylococcaceae bacterium]
MLTIGLLLVGVLFAANVYWYLYNKQKFEKRTRHLLSSQLDYKSIINPISHATILFNDQGIITYLNNSAMKFFGYRPEELIGQSMTLLTTKEFPYNYQTSRSDTLHTGNKKFLTQTTEILSRHKNGQLIPVLFSISAVKYQDEVSFIAIFVDLSEIKCKEHKLQQQKAFIERLAQLRTTTLEKENNHLRRLSEIDVLTTIANRRTYEHRLAQEISTAKRTKQPLAMMMIDIDYFKDYNDHYGHGAGDQALKSIAMLIKNTLPRKTDLAARIGGEEFAVLMPATNSEGAYRVAEHIRFNVEELAIAHHFSKVHTVMTLSIGITELQGDALNAVDLFNEADSALYDAKHKGRNQCVIYKKLNTYSYAI